MSNLLPILSDIIVIIFDLILYYLMSPTRKDTKLPHFSLFIGCGVIITAYFCATYIYQFPAAVSSAVCMSIPSFLLFLYFAKYRDSRFVLTFCFIDTISLIVAFIGRFIGLFFPFGEFFALLIMLILFITLLWISMKYASQYQKLLELTDSGWRLMSLSTISIYFALIFFAGYPAPLIQRKEYIPTWFTFAIVVILFYTVFIHSILKTKKITEQNLLLKREKEFYHMAYHDSLTGLGNRASYTEKLNDLERNRMKYQTISFLTIDINNFKKVNDTLGHHCGDLVLIAAASALTTTFTNDNISIFRMGGDEFLVILLDVSEEKMEQYVCTLRMNFEKAQKNLKICVSMAIGYETISSNDKQLLETVYIHADKKMYDEKNRQKKL